MIKAKVPRNRPACRVEQTPKAKVEQSVSTPALRRDDQAPGHELRLTHNLDEISASDSNLSARNESRPDTIRKVKTTEQPSNLQDSGDSRKVFDMSEMNRLKVHILKEPIRDKHDKSAKYFNDTPKKSRSCSPFTTDIDDPLSRQIRDIHNDTRKCARIIRDSRARLLEIQKKPTMTDADVKELSDRSELLLKELERFDILTRTLQKLIGNEAGLLKKPQPPGPNITSYRMYQPINLTERNNISNEPHLRSKSEIDLTRKLSECYDMQEKLVADNADLEVKRYILYKELMTKDQNLETCRGQVKRLQGELKLMNKENTILQEKLAKYCPESGDATAVNKDPPQEPALDTKEEQSDEGQRELIEKLQDYKNSSLDIEKHIRDLEEEVHHFRVEMDGIKSSCRGGEGQNTCFQQPAGGPPVPPMSRDCGVCPPCPASCNPNAPPTPAERELAKITLQLKQMEDAFRVKVTECAMLRAEIMKKNQELDKERCQHKEAANKLRELELRFEGLATTTNMALGSKEQALENEVNVRALKQCYREAREEIDDLRQLLKEQNEQLQEYRAKYLAAQQLVEEQKRQMDLMDMDNTRISEQINLEIQRVKVKFQEKLQELAPLPDLLKGTQAKLRDAQQAQAVAEHTAENLARELNCAREKVHALLQMKTPVPEKLDKSGEEKQIALLQMKINQLQEAGTAYKSEIERLKIKVIRMEEVVLATDKRLQEKMHECAQLGGELDRARDEAARAVHRANERTDTVRKCMQTTVAELERQLSVARGMVRNSEKEREELQCRMQCQMSRLNDNFEQAQLRIMGLQTQIQHLRKAKEAIEDEGRGNGDIEPEQPECACKSFFQN